MFEQTEALVANRRFIWRDTTIMNGQQVVVSGLNRRTRQIITFEKQTSNNCNLFISLYRLTVNAIQRYLRDDKIGLPAGDQFYRILSKVKRNVTYLERNLTRFYEKAIFMPPEFYVTDV